MKKKAKNLSLERENVRQLIIEEETEELRKVMKGRFLSVGFL